MEELQKNEVEKYRLGEFISPLQVLMIELDYFKKGLLTSEREKNIELALKKINALSGEIPIEEVTNPLVQKLLTSIKEDVAELFKEGFEVLIGKGNINKAIKLVDRISENYKECRRILRISH